MHQNVDTVSDSLNFVSISVELVDTKTLIQITTRFYELAENVSKAKGIKENLHCFLMALIIKQDGKFMIFSIKSRI